MNMRPFCFRASARARTCWAVSGTDSTTSTETTRQPNRPERGLASLMPKGEQALAPIRVLHPSEPDLRLTQRTEDDVRGTQAGGAPVDPDRDRRWPRSSTRTSSGPYPDDGLLDLRWDPLVVEVGGAWDRWSATGTERLGRHRGLGFSQRGAPTSGPAEFACDLGLRAGPDGRRKSFGAMRAGSFFAEHGHIVSNVAPLQVSLAGLPATSTGGRDGLRQRRPPRLCVAPHRVSTTDSPPPRESDRHCWSSIAISKDTAEVVYRGAPSTPAAFSVQLTVPPGGLVVRARGRRNVDSASRR